MKLSDFCEGISGPVQWEWTYFVLLQLQAWCVNSPLVGGKNQGDQENISPSYCHSQSWMT